MCGISARLIYPATTPNNICASCGFVGIELAASQRARVGAALATLRNALEWLLGQYIEHEIKTTHPCPCGWRVCLRVRTASSSTQMLQLATCTCNVISKSRPVDLGFLPAYRFMDPEKHFS